MDALENWFTEPSVDMDMKREAINKIAVPDTDSTAVWRSNASILTWLESL